MVCKSCGGLGFIEYEAGLIRVLCSDCETGLIKLLSPDYEGKEEEEISSEQVVRSIDRDDTVIGEERNPSRSRKRSK
ncbi:MAG: hypothetical protein DDT23_00003 [candidate division WS2 bacterium]|nr:hypothetical protein [Candidatus Lithacetigena glycinireducens]